MLACVCGSKLKNLEEYLKKEDSNTSKTLHMSVHIKKKNPVILVDVKGGLGSTGVKLVNTISQDTVSTMHTFHKQYEDVPWWRSKVFRSPWLKL